MRVVERRRQRDAAAVAAVAVSQNKTHRLLTKPKQRVYETTFCQRPAILKQRFSKRYRHAALDAKLTASRLRSEVRCMARARKAGVLTPALYSVEPEAGSIYMERVRGHSVKHLLSSGALDAAGVLFFVFGGAASQN